MQTRERESAEMKRLYRPFVRRLVAWRVQSFQALIDPALSPADRPTSTDRDRTYLGLATFAQTRGGRPISSPSSTSSSANPSALSARPHSRRASLWHQPEQEEGIKTATWRLHARAGLALTQLRFQLWCRMPVASFWTAGGDGRNWFLVLVFL